MNKHLVCSQSNTELIVSAKLTTVSEIHAVYLASTTAVAITLGLVETFLLYEHSSL